MNQPIEVCAAVILHGGRLLLATRPPGGHLAGKWEFPGGKVQAGETLASCIVRELQEELGLLVKQASLLFDVLHHYPEKTVRLHFLLCHIDPDHGVQANEGQTADWFEAGRLPLQNMAPADRITIENIRLGQWLYSEAEPGMQQDGLPVLHNPALTASFQDWLQK